MIKESVPGITVGLDKTDSARLVASKLKRFKPQRFLKEMGRPRN